MRSQRRSWVRSRYTTSLEACAQSPLFVQGRDAQLLVSRDLGLVCDANRAAHDLFRWRPDLLGARYADLVGLSSDNVGVAGVHSVVLASQSRCTATHSPLVGVDGEFHWLHVTLREVPADSASATDTRNETERLTHALAIAEERTRARIAAELHDDIGQLLSVVRLKLQGLADAQTAGIAAEARGIEVLVSTVAHAVRSTTFDLTSPVLQQLGFDAAIATLGEGIQRQSGIVFHQKCVGEPALSSDIRGVVYRVVRELMHNVQKHAHARNVWIDSAYVDGQLVIVVRDDGVGCSLDLDRARCTPDGGYGLTSGLAQMRGLGGSLVLRRAVPCGTEAILTLPLSELPQPLRRDRPIRLRPHLEV